MNGDQIYSRIFNGGGNSQYYDSTIHDSNVNKRLMERDNNFNYESRNSKKDNKRKEHHSKNKGEITKMDTKVDSYARGMPLRGGFEQNYMLENNNNYGLVDFEVFEKNQN